jgi:two-component system, sensor histidine kinase and response regulator
MTAVTAATSAHIVIVDDDAALLRALPETVRLRMPGVKIDTFDSAAPALEAFTATDYDVIISDIKMPGIDGLALLSRVRELRPDTPTLLITGHGEHEFAIEALRGGAYDFVKKPIDRDYFVASLDRALQTRELRRQVEEQRQALGRHAATLEQAVRERTRELIEANQVKDTFLSIASHELRTPLTSLKGLAQIARLRLTKSGAPEVSYLEKMERAIGRMETLVDDLVDVSRIDAGKLAFRFSPGNLSDLCRQVVEEQRAASEREIACSLPADPPTTMLDTDRISQVLANLISNALKFSPPDTTVTVTLQRHGDEAVISVRDQGRGILPEHLPHIFDRFYQAPGTLAHVGSKIGLGLGLFISHEIVARHGGRIWAESVLGAGSVFSFALPLAPVATPQQPTHEHAASFLA